MSQRAQTHKWYNCEPDFRPIYVEPERVAERIQVIVEDEKARTTIDPAAN